MNPTPVPVPGLPQLQQLFLRLINLMVPLAFIVLTIMLIVGGVRYLVSGGDSKATQVAGQTITWALLGILFLALAWVVLLLIKAFTGVDVTNFNLMLFWQ